MTCRETVGGDSPETRPPWGAPDGVPQDRSIDRHGPYESRGEELVDHPGVTSRLIRLKTV